MSSKPTSPAAEPASERTEETSSQKAQIESTSPPKKDTPEPTNAVVPAEGAPPLPTESIPSGPPLPSEPTPGGPPLPTEPTPQEDDGWDCLWDASAQSWYFANRFTGQTQWDNPRVPSIPSTSSGAPGTEPVTPQPPVSQTPAIAGYNPAIHGDYDPNAWYAQGQTNEGAADEESSAATAIDPLATTARFNRFTGQFQSEDMGPNRHSDEAKSNRQMNAFFDVDAAANSHDGRSLKAERTNNKPSKNELKAFKEKRRARKEEKRRAWLRD